MSLTAASTEFAQIFTPPPSMDWAAAVVGDDLKNFEKQVDKADHDMSVWRADTSTKLRVGLQKLEALTAKEAVPKSTAKEAFQRDFSGLLKALDEAIESFSTPVHERPDVASALAQLSTLLPSTSKFLRKQFRRIERLRIANYNAAVDWHYAILSFMSEFEPKEERGPTFSDPDEFEKFVRKSIA